MPYQYVSRLLRNLLIAIITPVFNIWHDRAQLCRASQDLISNQYYNQLANLVNNRSAVAINSDSRHHNGDCSSVLCLSANNFIISANNFCK